MRWIGWTGAAAVVALACAAAAQTPAIWRTYHNAKYGFSIAAPSDVEITDSPVQTHLGATPNLRAVFGMQDGPGALAFDVTDYSGVTGGGVKTLDDPNQVLETEIKSSVRRSDAILDSEQPVTVQGAPGRDIVFHSATVRARSRIVYRGRRLYILAEAGPPSGAKPAEYDRLVASLHLDP